MHHNYGGGSIDVIQNEKHDSKMCLAGLFVWVRVGQYDQVGTVSATLTMLYCKYDTYDRLFVFLRTFSIATNTELPGFGI